MSQTVQNRDAWILRSRCSELAVIEKGFKTWHGLPPNLPCTKYSYILLIFFYTYNKQIWTYNVKYSSCQLKFDSFNWLLYLSLPYLSHKEGILNLLFQRHFGAILWLKPTPRKKEGICPCRSTCSTQTAAQRWCTCEVGGRDGLCQMFVMLFWSWFFVEWWKSQVWRC